MAQQSTVSAWSECLFVYLLCAPHANNTDRGIGLPRETDKTHDQLQVGAGSPVCQVTKFPSTKSTEAVSVGRSFLPRLTRWCPRPADALNPSPQACAQLLSLIIKSNKLFSIDLHAGSSAVQKRTPAQPKKETKYMCGVRVWGEKNLTQPNPDPETSPLPAATPPPGRRLWLLINHSLGTFNV